MDTLKINHLAVWLLALVHQVIGFFWFSPYLFGDLWVQLTRLKAEDFQDPSPLPYFISLAGALALTYVMAWLFRQLQVAHASRGLFLGFLFWAGFVAFELVTYNAFELKPYGLAFIYAGKSLLTFCLSGLVLGGWTQKKDQKYKQKNYMSA